MKNKYFTDHLECGKKIQCSLNNEIFRQINTFVCNSHFGKMKNLLSTKFLKNAITQKKFREINSFVYSSVKTLLSRIFHTMEITEL